MRALIGLGPGDRGEATADLHRALDALGIAASIPEDERAHRRYGDGTREAVSSLQTSRHWPATEPGRLDQQCAQLLNRLLIEMGVVCADLDSPGLHTHAASDSDDGEALAAADDLALSLLPTFELTLSGASVALPSRAQRLVALLAIDDRPLCRTVVAARLWPDVVNARANASLRATLWSLPRNLPPVVQVDGNSLLLDPAIQLDLAGGRSLANAIVDGSYVHQPERGETILHVDLLPAWEDEWLVIEREGFRQLRLHALDELCVLHARAGRFARAVAAGLASVCSDPTRESAHRALITAHLLEGNRMEAIRQYHAYLAMAKAEMGIGPSDHLRRLFLTALQDAPDDDTVTRR
jgi:DNA-binding SARP family transcriptional activator